jgi:hypothetical protein
MLYSKFALTIQLIPLMQHAVIQLNLIMHLVITILTRQEIVVKQMVIIFRITCLI